MKQFKISILFVLLFVSIANTFAARVPVERVLDTATVEQQIDYVLKRSTTYEDYKVIKSVWVTKLRSNILDSLTLASKAIDQRDKTLLTKAKELNEVTTELIDTKSLLAQATKEKNSLKLAGIVMNKAAYNTLLMSIIIVLLSGLAILFILYKRSLTITNRTKNDLSEIKEEFEAHRKNAREREEKMARRHLDEVLKYKNRS